MTERILGLAIVAVPLLRFAWFVYVRCMDIGERWDATKRNPAGFTHTYVKPPHDADAVERP